MGSLLKRGRIPPKLHQEVHIDLHVKNLNDDHAVQIYIVGLSNEHVRCSLIHGNISTMHELVTHTHKFAEADEMKDHHYHSLNQENNSIVARADTNKKKGLTPNLKP